LPLRDLSFHFWVKSFGTAAKPAPSSGGVNGLLAREREWIAYLGRGRFDIRLLFFMLGFGIV
jgi:hypothetical protein